MLAVEFHWELPFPHHHWELSSAFSGRGLVPAPQKPHHKRCFIGANPALALQKPTIQAKYKGAESPWECQSIHPPAQLLPQTAAMSAACQHSRQLGWTCDERHHLEVKPWFTDQLKP